MAFQDTLSATHETGDERSARLRRGRIALMLSIAFWIVTAGGIIMMINFGR